jgi:hypothetical protein
MQVWWELREQGYPGSRKRLQEALLERADESVRVLDGRLGTWYHGRTPHYCVCRLAVDERGVQRRMRPTNPWC